MRIAPVVDANRWAILRVAFDDSVGRNGGVLKVALVRVGIDHHLDPGGGVAMDHVVGNAVQRIARRLIVLSEVRVKTPVPVRGNDAVHDGGRIGRDRGLGNVLVPRIVRREQVRPEQRTASRWHGHRQE